MNTLATLESREVLARVALRSSLKQFSNDSAFVGLFPTAKLNPD
jgi:hypothetical protein